MAAQQTYFHVPAVTSWQSPVYDFIRSSAVFLFSEIYDHVLLFKAFLEHRRMVGSRAFLHGTGRPEGCLMTTGWLNVRTGEGRDMTKGGRKEAITMEGNLSFTRRIIK